MIQCRTTDQMDQGTARFIVQHSITILGTYKFTDQQEHVQVHICKGCSRSKEGEVKEQEEMLLHPSCMSKRLYFGFVWIRHTRHVASTLQPKPKTMTTTALHRCCMIFVDQHQ
jgi:hypothetical protein